MKKSSRSFLLLSLMAVALVTSRCDCSSQEEAPPSLGRCEGFVGGQRISTEIDPINSYYNVNYSYPSVDRIFLSTVDGLIHMQGRVEHADSSSSGMVLNLPGEPPSTDGGMDGGLDGGLDGGMDGGMDGGTGGPADGGVTGSGSPEVESWWFSFSGGPRPRLVRGTLERSIESVEQRLLAVVRLFFEDGTSLTCNLELFHQSYGDTGYNPEDSAGCGGGSSGDSD